MHLLSIILALLLAPVIPLGPQRLAAPADSAPVLQNPGFECGDGYHDEPGIHGMVANGWTAKVLTGDPTMNSTQMWGTLGVCDPSEMGWEKLEGHDSNIFLASYTRPDQDFDAPPFDLALYQPVQVTQGTEYSLSAWMTSLCGGSATPSDCPAGAYIAKMAGLDAFGGTDPLAGAVQWTEDQRPHTEVRWTNLSTATTAQSSTLTVFLRINSPFHHHGNMAYADATKLVRAPTSQFTKISRQGDGIAVAWSGALGPDIPLIPATNHKLSFEVQVRVDDGAWSPWLAGQSAGEQTFPAPDACRDDTYQFRVRAWGIQPDGQPGARPNHHFVGVWHESEKVSIPQAIICSNRLYTPMTLN